MADIKKIKVDGTTYDIRDATAARSNHTHAYTPTSILPTDNGEIKTKYRIAKKDYTGGGNTYWYYEICKLPVNNAGNYASAIISGRIGGWTSSDMSYINALIWNRGTPGLAVIDIGGTATAASNIWNICDLVLYTNSDGTATLYAKCAAWFTFDLDLELFQSTATITYSGNKLTSVSGTLNSSASTTTSRMELINGNLYVSGTKMSKDSHSHDVSIAVSSEASELTLAHGTKYALTAGGQSFIFKTPSDNNTHNSHAIISGTKSDNSTQIKGSASSDDITLGDSGVTAGTYRSVTVNSKGIVVAGSSTDADTNTWRKVQLNGTDKLGTGTNTNPLNIKAGSNMTITESNGTFTFAATDTTYSTVSKTSSGLCPQLPNETTTTKYLRQDGTWVTPPDSDTKNTAGSTNDAGKLYLVGAKTQAANPQTYSNSSVYMTGGTLYASALNTGDIVGSQVRLRLQNPSGDGTLMDAAYFDSSDYDEPILGLYGHLAVYGDSDSSTNPNKPANQTAITDLDTDYFNTGIALKEADYVVYKLSFPAKSGTFALTSDIKSLVSNTTTSGGIKYITEASFTNGVLTLESKYLHLK